jgi:signal peptidase I
LTDAEIETQGAQEAEKKKPEEKETLPESISGFAAVFVAGLFILTFVIQQFEIPSGSMENTLLVGDHVFVDRLTPTGKEGFPFIMPYRDIHRGDIAVFPSPAQPGLYLVKRIIGVPGDRVHLRAGKLYLNGVEQNESYVLSQQPFSPYRDSFPAVSPEFTDQVTEAWRKALPNYIQGDDLVVPKDCYFAMGDHRDVSLDSRYWGFVPRRNIVGSPLFIAWSLNQTPEDFPTDATLLQRAESFVKTGAHFFALTRWNRVLRLVH